MRGYFRQGDTVFFTFLFPVLMLLIFSVAFSSTTFGPPGEELSAATYYLDLPEDAIHAALTEIRASWRELLPSNSEQG